MQVIHVLLTDGVTDDFNCLNTSVLKVNLTVWQLQCRVYTILVPRLQKELYVCRKSLQTSANFLTGANIRQTVLFGLYLFITFLVCTAGAGSAFSLGCV